MSVIKGDEQAVLAGVQAIFDEFAPGARCELQDYRHKIGCGNMDQWGNIQDVRFVRAGVTEEDARHFAQVLAIKVRTGGSTAG